MRLGDTGTFVKLDVIAQLDMMFDNKFMGEQDLFVPSVDSGAGGGLPRLGHAQQPQRPAERGAHGFPARHAVRAC